MYIGYAASDVMKAESEYSAAHKGLWKLETQEIHDKVSEFRAELIRQLSADGCEADYSLIKDCVFARLDMIYGFNK